MDQIDDPSSPAYCLPQLSGIHALQGLQQGHRGRSLPMMLNPDT